MAEQHIRAAQLADQIRDYLASWTAKDHPGSFVIITAVTLSPNQRRATVWFRVLNGDTKTVTSKLHKATMYYQHQLSQYIRRYKVPAIEFVEDNRPQIEE